jgi:PAS domain-containing protein
LGLPGHRFSEREVCVASPTAEPRQSGPQASDTEAQLHVVLDNMPGALVYTDDELNIVICNRRFREMYKAAGTLLEPGQPYPAFLRYLAQNGYYGPGDIETLVARRIHSIRNPSNETFEDRTPDGRYYRIRRRRVEAGGVVTVMTDVTDQKRAEREFAAKEARFHMALDNMPGALVYTDDDLSIIFCNERFKEMYRAPRELLEPGRPYPDFLRHLAENGYYGEGEVNALVARRVDSLRNPSNKTFEDKTPDGRVYAIRRRKVDAGGVVTIMTDITDQKRRSARCSTRNSAPRTRPASSPKRTRCWRACHPSWRNTSRRNCTGRSSAANRMSRSRRGERSSRSSSRISPRSRRRRTISNRRISPTFSTTP